MTETEGAGVWRGGKGKGPFHTNGVIPAAFPHHPQEGERGGGLLIHVMLLRVWVGGPGTDTRVVSGLRSLFPFSCL